MEIQVHLLSQSQPIEHANVQNAYTKDGLYCLYFESGVVHKYPLCNIFRITENYYDQPKKESNYSDKNKKQ